MYVYIYNVAIKVQVASIDVKYVCVTTKQLSEKRKKQNTDQL